MSKTQWICNLAVAPFVIAAIALFITWNFVYDLLKYGKVRPCHE